MEVLPSAKWLLAEPACKTRCAGKKVCYAKAIWNNMRVAIGHRARRNVLLRRISEEERLALKDALAMVQDE